MQPDHLDDLFRQQLGSHATPPPADLWARLQAAQPEAPEPLDLQFRAALDGHATPPRREVWERLEDEHLRPRPRRQRPVVLWWQLAAAALLLFALVGGGLWRGGFLGHPVGSEVATAQRGKKPAGSKPESPVENQLLDKQEEVATVAPEKKNQEIFSGQATAPIASPSSTPIASTTRPRRPATVTPGSTSSHLQGQQPDAATVQLAHTGGRKTPVGQQLHLPVAPATPAPEVPVLARATPDAAPQIIEVEVRRGRPPVAAPVVVAAVDAEPAPDQQPRRGLGGLLRRAGRLAQDQAAGLADATGLPDNLTVQARLGNRTLSKTIQL